MTSAWQIGFCSLKNVKWINWTPLVSPYLWAFQPWNKHWAWGVIKTETAATLQTNRLLYRIYQILQDNIFCKNHMLLPLQETVYEDQEAEYRFGGHLHRVVWTKPPATHCVKETSASGGFLETEDPPKLHQHYGYWGQHCGKLQLWWFTWTINWDRLWTQMLSTWCQCHPFLQRKLRLFTHYMCALAAVWGQLVPTDWYWGNSWVSQTGHTGVILQHLQPQPETTEVFYKTPEEASQTV